MGGLCAAVLSSLGKWVSSELVVPLPLLTDQCGYKLAGNQYHFTPTDQIWAGV